jgi:hypothetical protein
MIILTRRALSTSTALFRRFDTFVNLQKSVNSRLQQTLDEPKLLEAFKDIFKYSETASSKEEKNIVQLAKAITESQRDLDQGVLKQILLLKPPSTLVSPLLESYNAVSRDPIQKPLAELAVRLCLWDADIHNAVKVVDLTMASPRYLKAMTEKRNNAIMKTLVGAIGAGGAMHYGISLLELPSTAGVFAMVATYVLNMSFFGYVAFGGKFIGRVNNIRWKNGALMNYMYIHADEISVLSKIAEADIKINGHEGFASNGFKQAMERRNIELIPPETEQLLEEYWLTGGDNFEWVEPDQDPADIIWRKHIQTKKPNLLRDDIKWTDKFIAADSKSRYS